MIRLRKELNERGVWFVTADGLQHLIDVCREPSAELELETRSSDNLVWMSSSLADVLVAANERARHLLRVALRAADSTTNAHHAFSLSLETPAGFNDPTLHLVVAGTDPNDVEQRTARILAALSPLKASSLYTFVSRLNPVGVASLIWLIWLSLISLTDFERIAIIVTETSLPIMVGQFLQYIITLTIGLFLLLLFSGFLRQLHRFAFPLVVFAMGADYPRRQRQQWAVRSVYFGLIILILISAILVRLS